MQVKMNEGQCVCVSGGVCLPGHCVGRDSHYRLTVMVTSSDTLRLLSGELAVDRRWDVQRLCGHCTLAALSFFFNSLYIKYLCGYICDCVFVLLYKYVCVSVCVQTR